MAGWAIRAGLMLVGSWAASKGYATEADVETAAGAAAALAGAVWSARARYVATKGQ
jgi:hypothetical protein